MAILVKFNEFNSQLLKGSHQFNSGGHTFKIALFKDTETVGTVTSAYTPSLADTTYTGIAVYSREVSSGTGYTTGGTTISGQAVTNSGTIGVASFNDVTFTASGGDLGPFRYIVIYNATNGLLIGYYDYGMATTLSTGEDFVVDFDGINGVLRLG